MRALGPQLSLKPCLKPEWRKALRLLVRSPRGATEDVLELPHGFYRETLTTLTIAGFATVVTETFRTAWLLPQCRSIDLRALD